MLQNNTINSISIAATRQRTPLVHFITNYVTVNDCATITLAIGGSPIMADDPQEAAQITAICSSLVLNMGTPCERTVQGMCEAGKLANTLGHPVIFDPVGAGASSYRNTIARMLSQEVRCSVIKGNISEISFLANGTGGTQGVDACTDALTSEANLQQHVRLAQELSARSGAVIVISGPVDIIANSTEAWAVYNGDPMMARISGTGCMSAAVLGCFLGMQPDAPLIASLYAMCAMGICGEKAAARSRGAGEGLASYRLHMLDAMSQLDDTTLTANARANRI